MRMIPALVLAAAVELSPLFGLPYLFQQRTAITPEAFVTSEMKRQHIPGLSLAIVRDGRVVLVKGYGFANVEHQVPVKPETVFQSGSIGKQFTATAVMILVEEGRLTLDDKISKYFPDTPESWKDITVRHLLTHTSGMGDYPPEMDLRRDYTEDELLALIKAAPLVYRTGEAWDYSNLGYVLSGLLVRKVTGMSYGDFLALRVFEPLDMNTARVISESDIVANRASGYRLVNGELKNQEWVSPSLNTTADGSLLLTALDMAKWDAALYGDRPLKQSSLAEMWSPVRLSGGGTKAYGMGWHTEVVGRRRVISHGGAWQGFKSFIVRFPEERLTIFFFANLREANEFRLARGLAALFLPEFTLPGERPIEDREPEVTTLVKTVLRQLARDSADVTLFTAEARDHLFPQRAGRITESLNTLSLPVAVISSSLDLVARSQEGDLRVYRYTITDLGRTLFCTVKLTKNDRIADLWCSPAADLTIRSREVGGLQ